MAADLYPKKWGLLIDLDICTGCNACITACAMENNISFVGEAEVEYGRGMYWMHIQRYWVGSGDTVKPTHQPMMCQQCGRAPCEPVCPVFASVHSENEQINLQVYNRCIGTRYCANNCPYVARVFNWFDYSMPAPMSNYLNPSVTVRGRGVAEKCTFCVQRIKAGEEKAKAESRSLADGDIVPACGQACPSDAILFGDLTDPNSKVSKAVLGEMSFRQYEDLGTEPKVYYLKGGGNYGS
jgi:Fe-S-cluster-containing dehydrogenase component